MTAGEKRAGGFLPPEREARRVINNQDGGTGGCGGSAPAH